MSFSKQRIWWLVHPLLLALYFVLALLAANIDQVDLEAAVRPMIISLAGAGLVYGILQLLLRDVRKAALVTSLVLALFFTYGHVYNLLEPVILYGLQLGRHRLLIPIWGMFSVSGVWRILKARRISATVTQAAAVTAVVLVVLSAFQIGRYYLSSYLARQRAIVSTQQSSAVSGPTGDLPDVYLIILDSYPRQDVLELQYGFDNQEFIVDLEDLGFYVAECSLSNYNQTKMSLASMLNLEPIQTLIGDRISSNTELFVPYIKNSRVRRQFEAMGYRTIAFETGWLGSEIKDAELYFSPPDAKTAGLLLPFEAILLDTTAVFPILDLFTLQQFTLNAHYLNYTRELYVLDTLGDVPSIQGRKFVFAHILVPHQPYVFQPDGSLQTDPGFFAAGWDAAVDDEYDQAGLRNQVSFINSRILPLLSGIIEDSECPPVILLISDHGTYPHRNANLAALYLPGQSEETIYSTISLVNAFRLVLNGHFQGEYELLPDTSYIADGTDRVVFEVYQDDLSGCQP